MIEELRPFLPEGIATEVFDISLHTQPRSLRERLQEAIDASDGLYDPIYLGYGMCAKATVGLVARQSRRLAEVFRAGEPSLQKRPLEGVDGVLQIIRLCRIDADRMTGIFLVSRNSNQDRPGLLGRPAPSRILRESDGKFVAGDERTQTHPPDAAGIGPAVLLVERLLGSYAAGRRVFLARLAGHVAQRLPGRILPPRSQPSA